MGRQDHGDSGACRRVLGTDGRAYVGVLQNLADFLSNVFTGDWESAWENIKTIGSTLLEQFRDFAESIFELIWTAIGDKVIEIKDTIVEGFQKAIDWIKELPSQAVTWGRDIIQGIIDGIKGKIGGVVDSVKGIGSRITDFLGFSVPDEGPLTKFPEWMPHFMQGLAQGIRDNAPLVTDALKMLTGDMSAIVAAAGVGDITMRAAMTTQRSPYVTQNVEIENNFTGGDRAAQTEGARAMEKTEKDTTEALARALATGR